MIIKIFTKKYLPDILILFGIWLFAYNYFDLHFFPFLKVKDSGIFGDIKPAGYFDLRDEMKFFAVVIITLGADIAIRRSLGKAK